MQRLEPPLRVHRAKEDTAVTNQLDTLERSLFGYISSTDPSAVISVRDAADRAEHLEDSDAAVRLLTRAEAQNDPTLGRAIVRVAVERGWSSVLNEYETRHPGTGSQLQALAQLRRIINDGNYRMSRTITYALPRT